jgi:hypothetical protein
MIELSRFITIIAAVAAVISLAAVVLAVREQRQSELGMRVAESVPDELPLEERLSGLADMISERVHQMVNAASRHRSEQETSIFAERLAAAIQESTSDMARVAISIRDSHREMLEHQARVHASLEETAYQVKVGWVETARTLDELSDRVGHLHEVDRRPQAEPVRSPWERTPRLNLVISLNNLASSLEQTGQVQEALSTAERALAVAESIEEDPTRGTLLVGTLNQYAAMLRTAGKYTDAELVSRRAVALAYGLVSGEAPSISVTGGKGALARPNPAG